jgi:hypothetical protein
MLSAPITTPAPNLTPNLPNGDTSIDKDTGITPNQYALAPGESAAAYSTRIAGLRTAAGMPTPKTDASGAPTDSQSAEDQVAQSLGYKSYSDAVSSLTAPPTTDETDLYNSAYSAAGLDQLQNTITGRQNDLVTATGNINDNPWLDEADRVGRVKNVTDMATADIKNYQDEYNSKLAQVKDLVTRETADNTATSASNKAKLAALEAQAKQAAADQKTASAPPKTIKGANGATYTWNPTTQTFDQVLPGKTSAPPKPSTADSISSMDSELSSVTGSDGYINPKDWATGLSAWQAQGLPASSFISNFKKYANTADPTNNYTGLTKPK